MMNVFALTAQNASDELTFAERATKAGIVSLQGMLTIFLVLAILWGAIELMHYVLVGRKEKKNEKETETASADAVAVAPPVQFVPESAPATVTDDGAIVAAITAAISAQLASDGYTGGFRVVSFKRVGMNSKKRI